MLENRISAVLPDAVRDEILEHLGAIRTLSKPFLLTLTAEERKTRRRLGPGSVNYADLNREAVETFPTAYAADFGAAEFVRDVRLLVPLSTIRTELADLASQYDDACLQVGSEVMTKADESYEILKGRARRDGKYKTIVDRIKVRFAGQGVPKAKAKPKSSPSQS